MKRWQARIKSVYLALSAENNDLITKCDKPVRKAFGRIRLNVLCIFIGCYVSAAAFTYYLFEGNKWICLPVGLIWALLVTNMYLLLLYTVSPNILPVKKIIQDKTIFSASMAFRILFMSLLAIIIAQPINVLLLSPFAQNSLENYKIEYKTSMFISADSALIRNERIVRNDFARFLLVEKIPDTYWKVNMNLVMLDRKIGEDSLFLLKSKVMLDSLVKWRSKFSDHWKHISDSVRSELSGMLQAEIDSDRQYLAALQKSETSDDKGLGWDIYKEDLKKIHESKVSNYFTLEKLLEKSNFYIKRNQIILSENPISILITLLVVIGFLLPIRLKYNIRNISDEFYDTKSKEEKRLVDTEYELFKNLYRQTFKQQIDKYNILTWEKLMPLVLKLGQISPANYEATKQNITDSLHDEVEKFEYWANHPYRTARKRTRINYGTESDLLKLIYPENNPS